MPTYATDETHCMGTPLPCNLYRRTRGSGFPGFCIRFLLPQTDTLAVCSFDQSVQLSTVDYPDQTRIKPDVNKTGTPRHKTIASSSPHDSTSLTHSWGVGNRPLPSFRTETAN